MNEEELKVVDTEDTQTTSTDTDTDTSTDTDGRRPTGGMGTAGPKLPGNTGGKDQYSLREDEESTENQPVEGEDENGEE